ncbi:hypothetical protein [Pseudonocardia sp. GCM10023141]|uniref:hypothetical protein n=1 Tax=Pseudonocardia sp. GCM10023141 TaxID=3252653 RepID=UPI0036225699
MNREPDAEGGSDIGDGPPPDEFDAIVAAWKLEGSVPAWPADGIPPSLFDAEAEQAAPPREGSSTPDAVPDSRPDSAPAAAAPEPAVAPLAKPAPVEDEHFVPPEPPPLPRLGPPAFVGIGLLVLGLVLIISPGWVGVAPIYGLPLGLLGLAAGLGWLVLRLWPDSPESIEPDEDDDGAVL